MKSDEFQRLAQQINKRVIVGGEVLILRTVAARGGRNRGVMITLEFECDEKPRPARARLEGSSR